MAHASITTSLSDRLLIQNWKIATKIAVKFVRANGPSHCQTCPRFLLPGRCKRVNLPYTKYEIALESKALVKRRSFHAPNLLQLSSTPERPYRAVSSQTSNLTCRSKCIQQFNVKYISYALSSAH